MALGRFIWTQGAIPASARKLGHFCQSVLPETLVLAILCLADMAWTIIAVYAGIAKESNPIMAYFLRWGPISFALVKMVSFLLPLVIMELLRSRKPFFIPLAIRFALMAYVLLYVFGTLRVHGWL